MLLFSLQSDVTSWRRMMSLRLLLKRYYKKWYWVHKKKNLENDYKFEQYIVWNIWLEKEQNDWKILHKLKFTSFSFNYITTIDQHIWSWWVSSELNVFCSPRQKVSLHHDEVLVSVQRRRTWGPREHPHLQDGLNWRRWSSKEDHHSCVRVSVLWQNTSTARHEEL